ncbi:MAG TPA: sigma-70 family RNA polymerase sigma factor [Urbifossiella sp.]|nr:sigma-70 family RNA polymerase sigma factor [Urbifossiella sp.]
MPDQPEPTAFARWADALMGPPGPEWERKWHEFVLHYGPRIQAVAKRMGADAEEIFSRVMEKLRVKLPAFGWDPEKGFTPWLSRLVERVVLDYFAERRKTPGAAAAGGTDARMAVESFAAPPAPTSPGGRPADPDHPAMDSIVQAFVGEVGGTLRTALVPSWEALKAALERVGDGSREVVRLFLLESNTAAEVAARTKRTVMAVHQQVYRFKTILAEELEKRAAPQD